MPTYRVTDSVSGVTLDLTGDSPPTEQELQDIFIGYKPPEEPKPEDQSALRQVADVPLQFGTGIAQGVRAITDSFGADNAASQNIRGVEDYLSGLLSAQAKQDQQEVARIFQEAEGQGLGSQLAAGLRALAVSPVDFLAQGLGTAVPTIAGGLAGAALKGGTLAARAATAARVGTGLGAVSGTGIVKSTIYDEVKRELSALNLPEELVEERAKLAQEYGGENLDQILLGAGLGGLAAGTGLEKVFASRILKNAGIVPKSIKTAAFAGAKEAAPEFVQAAQEQIAGNVALQREGFEDIPTMRGVATAAALEGAIGFGLGAGINVALPAQQQQQYDAARANITNEVDRERESLLRENEQKNAAEFLAALEREQQRRLAGQDQQVNIDAEAASARTRAADIAAPNQDEVNELATPMRGVDISNDVQFGVAYGQKIARTLGDYFPNSGQFSVTQGDTVRDEAGEPQPTFAIIDTEGNRYGQPLRTFEQANATAYSLNKEVINQNVRGAILNSLETSSQAYDPETTQRLFSYGYRVLSPDANLFSTVAINEAAKTFGPEYAEALSWRQIESLPEVKDRRGRRIGFEYIAQGQQPRVIKGLTKAQELNKARSKEGKAESNTFNLQETKSALGKSFAAITKDVPIDPKMGKQGAINQIKSLLQSKNVSSEIDSREINALAKGLTGKSSVKDMDFGEIRLFVKKLGGLPRFEKPVRLPEFSFKPYNRENFVRASKFVQQSNAQGLKPYRYQIREAAGFSKDDPDVYEKFYALEDDLAKQGVRNEPQKPLALPAPPGGSIDLESLRDALRAKLNDLGLRDINLSLERNLIKPTGEIAPEGTEAMFIPAMKQVFLAVDRIDPDGSLTPEQRLNALSEVLGHEIIHALRILDLWKPDEWSSLEKAVARTQKPGTNQTYLQIAQANYADQSAVIQIEEAVADMYRDYAGKRLKIAGRPRNLLERLVRFFQRLRSALGGTGFQTYGDIISRIESGAIGSRQRGEIRTLRATEEAVAETGRIPERLKGILATPQGRQQVRQQVIDQSVPAAATAQVTAPVTSDFNTNILTTAAIRESRSMIDPVPKVIDVNGRKVSTRDSEGRLIYSGYEGEEVFNTETRPTMDGLRNFWNWFSKSKIMDGDKRPLVYYHGTAADITAFRPKQAGSVFLTRSPRFAGEFSALSQDYMVGNFTDFMSDEQIIDVLNETLQRSSAFAPSLYDMMAEARDAAVVQVPAGKAISPGLLQIFNDTAAEGRSSVYLDAIQKRLPSGANLMPVYVRAEKPWDYGNKDDIKAVVKRARENGADVTASMIEEIGEGNWQTIEGSEGNSPILDAIRELGYDSMFVEEGGQKNLAVFDPGQIKSAIGNNGDFSPLTPSIRESRVSKGYTPKPPPRLVLDNPGGNWLKFEKESAAKSGYLKSGAPKNFGALTATWRGQGDMGSAVYLPVSLLRTFRGINDEQNNIRNQDLDWLVENMGKTGKLPLARDGKEYPPFITVDQRGIPFVNEGNHRIMAADKLGFDWLPVNISYFSGGEEVDGPLSPNNIRKVYEQYVGATPSIRESRVRNPQIDTPEFQRFFADSKVVDANNQPLVVYHGTDRDIDTFKVGREGGALGNGIYFSPSAEFAGEYARREGGNVVPAYVSLKNPLVIDGSLSPDPMIEALMRLGVSENRASSIVEKAYDDKGYITTEVKSRAEKAGFDGILQSKNGQLGEIIAFRSNQIKSAVGNIGAFDTTRPSIRESRLPDTYPTAYQRRSVKTPSKATPKDVEMAEEYQNRTGQMPYLSDGQLQPEIPDVRYSIKRPYETKDLAKGKENDPILGLPLNKNGTVTLYYPATNEAARRTIQDKRLKGSTPTSNRIYLTNESSGPKVMKNPGNIDQPMDGANVLIQVDPSLLHIDQEYEDGRKDFFIQLTEGDSYAKKMKQTKLFTLDAPRTRALSKDTKLVDIERSISDAVNKYLALDAKGKRARLKQARDVLKKEHNVGTLMGENGKLQKTRIGDYGLTYDGKSVASMGLGLASAQRINEQNLSTCPKSAICEGLCLGETSGQNLLYGGEGQFKSGPRLSQYLKTEAIVQNPEDFAIVLYDEIAKFEKWSNSETGVEQVENEAGEQVMQPKQVYQPAIRLNVTSDFRPQTFASIINAFPNVMFYDYTKLPTRSIAPNHHMTYSSTGASQIVNGETIANPETNWDRMVQQLNNGMNVAMAFTSRTDIPDFVVDERTGQRFQVWDGDNYDARFLDPKREDGIGMIVGLTNKDKTTKPEDASKKYKGFFLDYDRARDGDALVIPDQRKISMRGREIPPPREVPRPQAQLDQAVANAEADVASTPSMAVPLYNPGASPEALYVAQNPEQGLKLTPDEKIRYSRNNQPQYQPGVQQILDKLTKDPPAQTPAQTVITSMQMPRFRDSIDKIRQKLIFNYSRLEFYNKAHPSLMQNTAAVSSLAAAEFADRSKALFAAAVKGGVPVYKNGGFTIESFVHNGREYKNGLIDVLAPLYNNPYGVSLEKLAQAYAIARRGERLTREGKLVPGDPADFPQLLSEVRRYINPDTGNSIIEDWHDTWQAYNSNTVKFLRDTGIIDDAGARLWLNQSDYFPFYRTDKTGKDISHPTVFGGLTSVTNLRALKGGEEAIDVPLMEAILTNLDSAIAMGMKNVAQQRIVRDMITIGLGSMVQPGQSIDGRPAVTFKVGGKKYSAFIDDPLIFESMQALPEVSMDGFLGNLFTAPARILRELIVREPGYVIANMLRDTASVMLTSGSNIIPVVDTLRNFGSGLENLEKFGVVGGYDFARDPSNVVKFVSDEARKRGHEFPVRDSTKWDQVVNSNYIRPLTRVWDALGKVSDMAEASTRNAVYEDTMSRTGNWVQAAYDALSVINYGRRGRNAGLRVITASVPFLNARIQGLDKLYQAATGRSGVFPDRKKNILRFVTRAGLMVGLTALYYAMVSDDELYENENPEVRDNYYIIPIKKSNLANKEPGFAFKIPIPFEVGILFKTIPERIMDAYYKDAPSKDLKDSLKRAVTSTLAFNPVPQVVLPIFETVANYDTFTGRSIVPQYMLDRDPIAQSKFGTNELARRLGEAAGISPLKLDHMMNGYLGSLGTYTLDMVDSVLRDNDRAYPERKWFEYPFVRRFFSTAMRPGLQEQFYELDSRVNGVVQSMNTLRKENRVDELQTYIMENQNILALKQGVNVLDKMMKNYRDQRNLILRTSIDPEEKRRIVDELDRAIALQLKIMPELRRYAYDEKRQTRQ